ncbi:hypothetical protein [Streptomyces scopuliridis]|uniref:Uncharacterized protein n=2 Tax=Streptomyces scopuliridis TaxID=452529 RepID=A0ACD4ZUZ1_9ACTN|nr:hypothetical protein [Streptomyces scopuliridis]WSC01632.1 hypothetical protein OG835_34590 [Streptomyces scopuliridis]
MSNHPNSKDGYVSLDLTDDDLDCYRRAGMGEEFAPDDPHVEHLTALGLLIHDPFSGRPVPADIRTAEARLRREAEQSAAGALRRMELIPAVVEALERERSRSLQASEPFGGEFLTGTELVNDIISRTTDGATHEQLSAQPGVRRPEVLARALERDAKTLRRGVMSRMLYAESARGSDALLEYVIAVTGLGAQVRTTEEEFSRIIIVDQAHAFFEDRGILEEESRGAWHIQHRGTIGYLIQQFQQRWVRARPWYGAGLTSENAISSPFQRSVLWELEAGADQKQIANRFGVSVKTINRAVADLRMKLGFKTPYQLGPWWLQSEERNLTEPPPPPLARWP